MLLLPLLALADYWRMLQLVAQHTDCGLESCHAQPISCPAPVPGLASSRPRDGRYQNYSLNFFNTASEGVVLSWLEPNGTARPVMILAPGEKKSLRSRTGDIWQAHSNDALTWGERTSVPDIVPANSAPSRLLMEYQGLSLIHI
eukprot:5187268-Prymnesium_polylepis.2